MDENKIIFDYVNKGLDLNFLYRKYKCSKWEIINILQKNNIVINDYFILDKETLFELYINKNETISSIASYYNRPIKDIKNLLKHYKIEKTKEQFNIARLKKVKEGNLKKYGVEFPLQSKKIIDKTKETVKNKYNVDNVFQSEKIKNKIKNTMLKKYNVEYNSQRKEIKEQLSENIKKNKKLQNRKNITETGEKYIDNFENYLNSIVENNELLLSTKEISVIFGVAENTIINKIRKYNESLIKNCSESSWEIPVKKILEKNNIKYIKNYRKLSKGKYEIDFFLPELNIGIEVNPYLTHSFYSKYELLRDIPENYHFNKFDFYINKNIFIYNIWEEDYKNLNKVIDNILNKESINNENNYFILGRDYLTKEEYLQNKNRLEDLYRVKNTNNQILFFKKFGDINKDSCKFIIKEPGIIDKQYFYKNN